jgi:primosomal protein N'
LERVDLHFLSDHKDSNEDRNHDVSTFWRFVQSFRSAKEMRLRVKHLEDIAVYSEARRAVLLPPFCHLARLEVQGVHWTKGKTVAVTIVNLLRCCPVLSAF